MLGISPIVIKNDELTLDEIKKLKFERILLSPGWGNPDNSGVTMDVIDFYKDKTSILGVCLGMQCIAKYFGGEIVHAPEPFHGKNSDIYFDKDFELFKGLKQGFSATRYHSLIVSNIIPPIIKTAETKDGIPMAIKVDNKKIYGVQFHPEAILTENGIEIFKNWINI
jgi:anthranilate synthase/aminodeoxychorismate synthase-like glutamine amidotransferase